MFKGNQEAAYTNDSGQMCQIFKTEKSIEIQQAKVVVW